MKKKSTKESGDGGGEGEGGGRVRVDMLLGYKWKETVTLSMTLDFRSLGGSDIQYCHLWGELREEEEEGFR